jgi:hypothetical protein
MSLAVVRKIPSGGGAPIGSDEPSGYHETVAAARVDRVRSRAHDQSRSRTAVRTFLRIARDLLGLLSATVRSHARLAAENFRVATDLPDDKKG